MAQQLVLPFGYRVSLDRRDFIVADCNREALALVDRWPDWPHRAAILHGPAGSGKTHLATSWAVRARARIIDGASLTLDSLAGALARPMTAPPPAIVVDHADRAAERPLLHLHNLILEDQGFLLLTARTAPVTWPFALPDLTSRLRAAIAVELGQPDDMLLTGVLMKLLADRQLSIPDPVVPYLVSRMERSLAAADQMIDRLDRESFAEGRPITLALARRILAHEDEDPESQLLLAF